MTICQNILFSFSINFDFFSLSALALKKKEEEENKRHTMSHPPDHIPDLDSPRQSRSPLKKDKKERVSCIYFIHF